MEKISSDIVYGWISSCGEKEPLPWSAILPKASPDALEVIERVEFALNRRNIHIIPVVTNLPLETKFSRGGPRPSLF